LIEEHYKASFPLIAVSFFILMLILVLLRDIEAINHFVVISATYYPTSKMYVFF
jgi:hypothetical protein